ncbi:MAG: hypothetical protein WCJ84_06165 [Candidatus Peregrinibacteria bacterium]
MTFQNFIAGVILFLLFFFSATAIRATEDRMTETVTAKVILQLQEQGVLKLTPKK